MGHGGYFTILHHAGQSGLVKPGKMHVRIGCWTAEMLTTSPGMREDMGPIPTLPPVYLEFACSPRGRVDFTLDPPVLTSTFTNMCFRVFGLLYISL